MLKRSRIVSPNNLLLGTVVSLAFLSSCGADERVDTEDRGRAKVLTVCQLFEDLPSYRGRVVTVTGIYWRGLGQTCAHGFVTGNHVWPSVLNLVDSDYLGGGDEPVSFRTDRESWDRLDAVTVHEADADRRGEIWVTIVGALRARRRYVLDDKQIVSGYGHLGLLPAELVVLRVLNINVKANPTYDYRELLRGTHGGQRDRGKGGQTQ
jgi:hypothetical protein